MKRIQQRHFMAAMEDVIAGKSAMQQSVFASTEALLMPMGFTAAHLPAAYPVAVAALIIAIAALTISLLR